eukprot:TRINITY_DN2315_c0_g1_i1.p1 TRINITY_DN2315_c0_g1~~TRINITY_DN2315_c0_g1_i1.p1  ORF type:complete len:1164 (+),score=337.87 TRINITY_DN2315_c0_g1_i1:166-3657(+)
MPGSVRGKRSLAQIDDIDFDMNDSEPSESANLLDNESDAGSDHNLDPWVTKTVPLEDLMRLCDKDMRHRRKLMDFFVHSVTLTMFVFILFGLVGSKTERNITQQFYTTQVLKDRVLGNVPTEKQIDMYGEDLASPADWALWAQSVTIPNLFDCVNPDMNHQQLTAQGQNYLIGSLRVRTRRMRNDSCTPSSLVFDRPEEQACYDYWHEWSSAGEERTIRHGFPSPALYPQWADLVSFDHPPPDGVALSEVMFGVLTLGAIVPVDLSKATVLNNYGKNPPGKGPANVVDQNPNSEWEDGDFGELILKFDAHVRVEHMTFVTAHGNVANDPVRWTVAGSDNGVFWTPVLEQTWVYPTPKERGAQMPWFPVLAPANDTFVSFRQYKVSFTQLRDVPNDASSNYRVNWEPSPYDPDQRDKSDVERGLVPNQATAVQVGEIRLRTDDAVVDAGLGYGGMSNFVTLWVMKPGQVFSVNDTSDYPDTQGRLVDGRLETAWEGVTGSSVVLRLPKLVTLNAFSFVTASERPWKDPTHLRFEGSNLPNDPGSWEVLADLKDFSTPLRRGWRVPWIGLNKRTSAPRIFQYYRITFLAVRGGVAEEGLLYQHIDSDVDFLERKTYGRFSDYRAGGYAVDIPFNTSCNAALATVRALTSVNYPFLDNYATRVTLFEFITYTPQFNDFVFAQFISEVAHGLWRNRHSVKNFSVYSAWDESEMWYFGAFYILVLYLLVRFFGDWYHYSRRKAWRGYIMSFWNLFEFSMLCLFVAAFVFRMMWFNKSRGTSFRLRYPARYPDELAELSMLYETYKNILESCAILVFLRTLRFATLVDRLGIVNMTVSGAKYELIGCSALFIHMGISFAICANVLFGQALFEYRLVSESYNTLSLMLLGDFDYASLKRERIILAPIFFWLFLALVFFVLLSFSVAILLTKFAEVSATLRDGISFDEYATRKWVMFKRQLHPRRMLRTIKLTLKGRTRATILEGALDEMQQYWKLAMYCSTCSKPVTCVCKPAHETEYHILGEHCEKCGSTATCTAESGRHCQYAVDSCVKSVRVTRGDMRTLLGEQAFNDLGKNGVDDLWQTILWERKTQRMLTTTEEEDLARTTIVEEVIDGKGLQTVEMLDKTLQAFEQEVYNLRMLVQDSVDQEFAVNCGTDTATLETRSELSRPN